MIPISDSDLIISDCCGALVVHPYDEATKRFYRIGICNDCRKQARLKDPGSAKREGNLKKWYRLGFTKKEIERLKLS